MKHILILILVVTLSLECFTQPYELKIIVSDSSKNLLLSNANIRISDKYFLSSDNNGEAVIKNIPAGSYMLIISYVGYRSSEEIIEVRSDTVINIGLFLQSFKLEEVIVTSGRYEKDLNYLPYSVSIVKKSDINNNPAQTLSDLIKSQSGISLLRDGIWGTEISIRGLNRSNVVTLIDGSRAETATDISARLSMFDINDIERIEVIKGAASSLYGTGATGGIINIISKSGSYSPELNISGNFTSGFSSVNNLFANGLSLFSSGKNWLAKIVASYRKADNTKTPSGELFNSQFEDNSISALWQMRPFENHEVKFTFQRFKALDVGIPGAAPLFPNTAVVKYPQEERQLFSAEYKINNISHNFVKLGARFFHHYISREVENIPGTVQYLPAGNGQPFRRVSVLKINPGADHFINGGLIQTDFAFKGHYLIAGLDLWMRKYDGLRTRDQKIEILNNTDSSVVRTILKTVFEKPVPDSRFYSAGLFLQDDIKINEKLNITLGGRYDYIWIDSDQTLNPLFEINDGVINNSPAGQNVIWNSQKAENNSYSFNIGLNYKLSGSLNLALNAARSFRSPSLEERYQYIDLGSFIRIGDPELKPEQGYYFDFGLRYFPENIKFNSSIFINSLTDLVSEEPGVFENRNALIKVNIGKALLYGFDYSFTYYITDEFSLYNTLSFVRGINRKDDRDLSQIPPLNGILGLRHSLTGWLILDLSAVVFDRQNKVGEGEKETPGYACINLRADIADIKSDYFELSFSAGIENLFNKDYRNHLSTNRGFIISEPGRNFYVKTNIKF